MEDPFALADSARSRKRWRRSGKIPDRLLTIGSDRTQLANTAYARRPLSPTSNRALARRATLLHSRTSGTLAVSQTGQRDFCIGTPPATPTDTATATGPPWRCSTLAAPTWRPPSTVSHELLNSKHKSSSLAGIARTAASGVKRQCTPRGRLPLGSRWTVAAPARRYLCRSAIVLAAVPVPLSATHGPGARLPRPLPRSDSRVPTPASHWTCSPRRAAARSARARNEMQPRSHGDPFARERLG